MEYKGMVPFIPDWGKYVSQDYPFEDGVSGKIALDITAKSDIFVRDGSGDKSSDFSNINQRYFIPGTSIKGSLRSVLEIVSFGKLTRFNNDSFDIRDIKNSQYRDLMNDKIKMGWFVYHNGNYYIYQTEKKPKKIDFEDVDELLDRESQRSLKSFITGGCIGKRNALDKYRYVYGDGFNYPHIYNGEYLIFTGQSAKLEFKHGERINKVKHNEFLFPQFPQDDKGNINVDENNGEWRKLTDDEVRTFNSIHKDSSDYNTFWIKHLKNCKPIPVFYIVQDGVIRFGLTYMFKLPAKKNVEDAIPQNFRRKEHDMAELIFGYTDDNDSLRGRVHVGHAFTTSNDLRTLEERKYILSSPHASYYPLYVKDARPWNSNGNLTIAGFKRYPTAYKKDGSKPNDESGQDGNGKMLSHIKPLPAGTKFSCEITFHNLKPEELGALLYVLDSRQIKYHQFGGLKPYRYGKVSIRPTLTLKDSEDKNIDAFIGKFKTLLSGKIDNWEECSTIKELKSMAEGFCVDDGTLKIFKYMDMSKKEFVTGKDSHKSLKPFSELWKPKGGL
jgi:CRISPR-associated protein (TIGR03986 family)